MNKILWLFWGVICLALAAYFALPLISGGDKSAYLIGETTYGHHQIEMSCDSCHTSPFGGKEVLQDACTQCHAVELDESQDSHPKSKFTDPREAFRLENIDARYCISCHVEHQRDETHAMGVTLPDDYCYHCHVETVEERESHQDLPFDSCADAGCHNYHDNRALYESFLVRHANQPWIQEVTTRPTANHAKFKAKRSLLSAELAQQITLPDKDTPHDWDNSVHQVAGLQCVDCHSSSNDDATEGTSPVWLDKPGIAQCEQCHQNEASGFKQGKHGMRLSEVGADSVPLDPMTPRESDLSFHNSVLDASQGCNACHSSHSFDTTFAAAEACLTCHSDEHSLSYDASPHGEMRKNAINQGLDLTNTVSCATCHMPLISAGKHKFKTGTLDAEHLAANSSGAQAADESESSVELWRVQHNQNWNLRPNEKMIRPVCLTCHSLEFSIDALADPALIQNNFNGKPSEHVESIDWAVKRDQR